MFLAAAFAAAADQVLDERAALAQCQDNLHRIGQGLILYANANRGAFPKSNWDLGAERRSPPRWGSPYADDGAPGPRAEASAKPFAAGDVRPLPNDVTAGLFMIARAQRVPA